VRSGRREHVRARGSKSLARSRACVFASTPAAQDRRAVVLVLVRACCSRLQAVPCVCGHPGANAGHPVAVVVCRRRARACVRVRACVLVLVRARVGLVRVRIRSGACLSRARTVPRVCGHPGANAGRSGRDPGRLSAQDRRALVLACVFARACSCSFARCRPMLSGTRRNIPCFFVRSY
jgi:hypothetical protein